MDQRIKRNVGQIVLGTVLALSVLGASAAEEQQCGPQPEGGFLVHALALYAQMPVSVELTRQAFSILSDQQGTSLGAELLVGEYPSNTTFATFMDVPETGSWTNTPEYLVIKQSRMLAKGNIDGAVADFAPADREKARKIFADPKGLTRFFSDLGDFRFVARAQFGPLTRVRYMSSPLASANGRRATLSAYFLRREDGTSVFVTEPAEAQLFAFVAAAFPHWKSKAERSIPERENAELLNATFTNGGERFEDSRMVIKYKLTPISAQHPVAKFIDHVITVYQRHDTNEIISLWGPGFDQVAIKGMIQNKETRASADYFSKGAPFTVPFCVIFGNHYWVYVKPSAREGELKLIRLLKQGDTFRMTAQFDEVFADRILTSDEMLRVFLLQAQK